MALSIAAKPQPWTPGINRRNSISQGLLCAYPMWNPGTSLTDVSGNNLHLPHGGGAPNWGGGRFGTAWIGDNTNYFGQDYERDLSNTNYYTMLLAAQNTTASAIDVGMALRGVDASEDISGIRYTSGNQLENLGDYSRRPQASTDEAPRGDNFVAIHRWQNRSQLSDLWVDGVLVASDNSFSQNPAIQEITIGGRSGAQTWNGPIYTAIVWERYLSDPEVVAMSVDPFALFRRHPLSISLLSPKPNRQAAYYFQQMAMT